MIYNELGTVAFTTGSPLNFVLVACFQGRNLWKAWKSTSLNPGEILWTVCAPDANPSLAGIATWATPDEALSHWDKLNIDRHASTNAPAAPVEGNSSSDPLEDLSAMRQRLNRDPLEEASGESPSASSRSLSEEKRRSEVATRDGNAPEHPHSAASPLPSRGLPDLVSPEAETLPFAHRQPSAESHSGLEHTEVQTPGRISSDYPTVSSSLSDVGLNTPQFDEENEDPRVQSATDKVPPPPHCDLRGCGGPLQDRSSRPARNNGVLTASGREDDSSRAGLCPDSDLVRPAGHQEASLRNSSAERPGGRPAMKDTVALPREFSPLILDVLGLMNFRTGPIAHVYQAAGYEIPKKCEAEQAWVLHRYLVMALEHGDQWREVASNDLEQAAKAARLIKGLEEVAAS